MLGLLTLADGRETVVLQPSRPAALLAALLLNANSVVSAEFLQRVIWGDVPPDRAKSALHSCVLRLRRLFGKYGVAGNPIEAMPGGYRFTADAHTLDLVEFRELLDRAYSRPADEPEKELGLLRAALALWKPPLLTNVPSDLLHRDEVPRLHEEWLRAIQRVFDLELVCGRPGDALGEIWPATRDHPLNERFTGQLMTALYRTGRRAEALAEYRRFKTLLAEQLGVDPGPALQRLELAILRGEADDGPVPAATALPAAPPAPAQATASRREPRPADPAPHPGADAYAARDRTDRDPAAGPAAAATAAARARAGTGGATDDATGEDPADTALLPAALVLDRLVGAGLLQEGPHGHYRMHELLRVFTRAAAADGVGARAASGDHPTNRPLRPGAVELHPTEA
ncbi:AfsR/SARP family transcriptional regulator [Actinacidiphila acididurans]|uniref:AfsR/SARP family transcriptional regulator n=1 Tax=Actinacidiphila acididurans TaxID=2784346 RepID=UPI00355764DE